MRGVLTLLGVLLRDAVRHPLQAAAGIGGVALGLAIVIAVHAAGRASRDSFARTFEAVAGRATHQLVGTAGLPPDALLRALAHPGVVAAQPVIEGVLPVIGWTGRGVEDGVEGGLDLEVIGKAEAPLRLLGIDPFRVGPFVPFTGDSPAAGGDPLAQRDVFARFITEPGAILAPVAWASARGLTTDDVVTVVASGRRAELRIVGLLPQGAFPEAGDTIAVADLATADELFGRGGRLDRIDVIADPEADLAALAAPGEIVERPATRGERAGKLTDAFRLNLLALSSLALIVGSYLVFNAAQFAVVRRESLLGQLRCLGASRGALLAAVVLELAMLGAIGSAVGLAGGSLLARLLVGDVARTVSTLYGFVRVETATVTGLQLAVFFALGVGIAVLAGWLPAREAAGTPPRMVGSRSAQEAAFGRRVPQMLAVAGGGAALALVALLWPTRAMEAGFVAALGILLCAGALVPPLLAFALPRLRAAADRRGATWLSLAAGEIERSLSRTGIATSALAVSLAMAVGVMVMIASFEAEVTSWVDDALVADLYVAPFRQDQSIQDARVPAAAIAAARALPGVERVDVLRGRDAVLQGRLIRVLGVDSPGGASLSGRTFLSGDVASAWRGLQRGGAIVSEPLSQRFAVTTGDVIELPASSGALRCEIVGVVRDYALERGYVMLDAPTYVAAFGDEGVANIALTLEEGRDAAAAARALREAYSRGDDDGPYLLEVAATATIKKQVGVAFDQTFAVTRVLQALATGLALAGIATALASLFLERMREVATLRALGASLGQVAGIFFAQGGLLALAAVAAALPAGAVLSWLLVSVVNLRSFGWGIAIHWPAGDLLRLIASALLAGLVAALVPWLLARRTEIAPALREE